MRQEEKRQATNEQAGKCCDGLHFSLHLLVHTPPSILLKAVGADSGIEGIFLRAESGRPKCTKIKGWPLEDAPSKLVELWYISFE